MPKKPNKAGNLQNYVPQGNGDASGEYADEQTGSNIHFTNFQKPDTEKQKKLKDFEESLLLELTEQELSNINSKKKQNSKFEDLELDLVEEKSFDDLESDLMEEIEEPEPLLTDKDLEEDDLDLPTFEELVDESLDESGTKDAILCLSPELDKDKVNQLDEKQAKKLLKAIETTENAQKKQEKLYKKYNKQEFEGIWKDKQTVASLVEKFGNSENVLKSLEEKQLWAETNKPELAESLSSFDKEGLKSQIDKYLAKKTKLDNDLVKAEKLIDKYQDPNNMYSQKRKDKAVWCKSISETKKLFPSIETKGITSAEQNALVGYTSSYSFINEPLRGIKYGNMNTKKEKFVSAVTHMTSAIDKSVIDFDFWTQRGTNQVNFPNTKINNSTSIEELQKLVGTKFEDQAFVSTGAAKNTGFSTSGIILNIYCPKGTKGAYVDNISSFSGENELILQRGYSYKVTKVEKKGGKIYMDCDLILGSDANKYTKEQLEEIKEKYFY